MNILAYLSLIIYIVFLALNIYFNIIDKNWEKGFFKVLLMPVLAIFYLSVFKDYGLIIMLAIVFSWFGDVFLLKTRQRDIIFGMLSFSLAHIMYILQIVYKMEFKNINYIFVSILIVLYFGIGIFISTYLREYVKKTLKNLTNLIYVYGTLLSILGIFSMIVGLNNLYSGGIYLMLGSNLFILSDIILSYNLFIKNDKISSILVMFIYSISQLFLIIGFGYLI